MTAKTNQPEQERAFLQGIATRGEHSIPKMLNVLILLNCDEGPYQERKLTAQQIADAPPVSMRKVDRVAQRFVEHG